jgi:hypothetical protein
MLVFMLASFYWTKSLLCNDAFKQGSAIQSASRRFCTVYKSEKSDPLSRPDDVIYRPNAQLSKASSVRTTRTFRPDLPLCREASNCSSLHPSGRFSSTSR